MFDELYDFIIFHFFFRYYIALLDATKIEASSTNQEPRIASRDATRFMAIADGKSN